MPNQNKTKNIFIIIAIVVVIAVVGIVYVQSLNPLGNGGSTVSVSTVQTSVGHGANPDGTP